MPEVEQSTVNPEKLNAFVGRMLGDLGALSNAVLVHVGDQLGLYKALVASGVTTSTALAERTGTSERLVREWLSAQAAQGYVTYDSENGQFSLSAEQAMVFANEESPVSPVSSTSHAGCSTTLPGSSAHSRPTANSLGTSITAVSFAVHGVCFVQRIITI